MFGITPALDGITVIRRSSLMSGKPYNVGITPALDGITVIRRSSLMSRKHYNVGMTPDRSISGLIL